MRTVGTFVGLSLMAWAAQAHAQLPAPPPPAESAAAPSVAVPVVVAEAVTPPDEGRRLQLGINVIPLGLGKLTANATGNELSVDGAFALGVGILAAYDVVRWSGGHTLNVGIAPQIILNGKPKEQSGNDREIDLFARIAYKYRIPKVASLYAEFLPGFSTLKPASSTTNPSAKGLIFGGGIGAEVDLTEGSYLAFGAGLQHGLQKAGNNDYRTEYVRVTVGAGFRF